MYDYLLVGAGLFNAVFAYFASKSGKKCLLIEKRPHIGGNCYTEDIGGIQVHKYGAHIFRTDSKKIWDFMNRFADFNRFTNSPMANYKGEIYNLPFNMNTFSKMWGIAKPLEAQKIIEQQASVIKGRPANLEEYAISQVGGDIYEKLIKGYTEKQWGRDCRDLPVSIMRRIPIRFTYDNNYYNASYQGIPIGGYAQIFEKMLANCDVELNTDFNCQRDRFSACADKIIYTAPIDAYYGYRYGVLQYRSLWFETESLNEKNYQGVAVVNFTDRDTPYTRIIEHKHFEFGTQDQTVITKEYPLEWKRGMDAYYPINDDVNTRKYREYQQKAREERKIIFAGRLGSYQYTDMQDTVRNAIQLWESLSGEKA